MSKLDQESAPKKAGVVALIGRPNAGKSTLVNALIGTKVAITSPRPKTTQFPIRAVYEDERGQIVFVDTPGLSEEALQETPDIVLYIIDQSRERGDEENKTLGLVRKFENVPKVVVFNKIDKHKSSKEQYLFLEDEADAIVEISARENIHLKNLLNTLFEYLPEGEQLIDTKDMVSPVLDMTSKTYMEELIREKIYLFTGQEVPYHTRVEVNEIAHRKNGGLYVNATIYTDTVSHKRMLIGKDARKIKQIGTVLRKELTAMGNKKVYTDLTVETV